MTLWSALASVARGQAMDCSDLQPLFEAALADPFTRYREWSTTPDPTNPQSTVERTILERLLFECLDPLLREQSGAATVDQAASLHVLFGLHGFSRALPGNKETPQAAHAHFCSARGLRADMAFPSDDLGADLQAWWDASCTPTGERRLGPGKWAVDGTAPADVTPASSRARPYLLQRLDANAEAERTWMVEPGHGLPDGVEDGGRPRSSKGPDWLGLGLLGAGLAATSAGTVIVVDASVVKPATYSGNLTRDGWTEWRDTSLVPAQRAGFVVGGAGIAALVASTVAFSF